MRLSRHNKLIKLGIVFTILFSFTFSIYAQDPVLIPLPNSDQGTESQQTSDNVNEGNLNDPEENDTDIESKEKATKKPSFYDLDDLSIFGHNLFNNPGSNFAPNTNRPVPLNYILGPGDRILINITGNSVVSWRLSVHPDGAINLPGMGKLYIGGKTLENATESIEDKLRAHKFSIGNGTDASVTLVDIRTIKATIMGQVNNPGTYSLSSLTTVFNALYESGGISRNGSIRAIELYRNNQLYARIDAYDYLLRGDLSGNFQLKDDDIIRIPEYRVRVKMEGEVKRNAYYDVLPGETLRDIVIFSGGFTDQAYVHNIKATQVTDKQYRVKDIRKEDIDNYIPLKGDHYIVDKILDRYENRVSILGSVFRPGYYELEDGLTLKELIIQKADGLREDAYPERGYISRVNEDNSVQIIPFYVKAIVNGTAEDILLQREDAIDIPSIFDITESHSVNIRGFVRNPGIKSYFNDMTVEDLILQSGGFIDGANMHEVQIARRVKNSDVKNKNAKLADIITIKVDPQLKLSESKLKLHPYDVVSVHALPGFVQNQIIKVEGEVMRPGYYAMERKDERLSDLVKRFDGFTAFAYLKGATLQRGQKIESINDSVQLDIKKQQLKNIQGDIQENDLSNLREGDKLQKELNDSLSLEKEINKATFSSNFVGIDLEYIMKNPGSKKDLILMDGDIIYIPRELQTVKVIGEVYTPITIIYDKKLSLKDYVLASGGYTQYAFRKKPYVVYANGSIKGTKSFLFFKNHPTIEPGAEIFIPKKIDRESKFSPQTMIAMTSSLTALTTILLTIVNLSK